MYIKHICQFLSLINIKNWVTYFIILCYKFPGGVMANVLDYNIELTSSKSIHTNVSFWTHALRKGINPLTHPLALKLT